jgi:hypothetical protein
VKENVMAIELVEEDITAPRLLDAAAGHMRARASTYDKPEGERSMALTVAVFNTFHGTSLTEAQGWHFMQILKDVRLFTRPTFHQDSAEDGVAYAALKGEAKAREDVALPEVVNPTPDEKPIEALDKSEGWIEWRGGERPVPLDTVVEYRVRGVRGVRVSTASRTVWSHHGGFGDIVAYRVVPEK